MTREVVQYPTNLRFIAIVSGDSQGHPKVDLYAL